MKESEKKVIINNHINEKENQIYHHDIKTSTMPFDTETKPEDIRREVEVNTLTTSLQFLKENEGKKDPLSNLNQLTQNKEEISNNNLSASNNSKDEKSSSTAASKESFYQKTKRWAGTVWSYMNVKNYFPKTEYIEYRNCNGDMVKVPKQKLPLKKKKKELDDEEYIVNKTVDRDRTKINFFAADNIPLASNFI